MATVAAVAVATAAGAVAANAQTEPGFETLFDGRTFAGWNGDTARTWRVEEGAIVAGSDTAAAPRNEFLATDREFGDFELRLLYRLEFTKAGNAGVQFRSRRVPDHHEVSGYQADIGPGYFGALYDESRRNRILVTPAEEVVSRALAGQRDGWNDYRIRCQGPRVRLWLNGVETVDWAEPEPESAVARKGMVALQIHGGMVGTVRYREIRIQPLPAAE
jgi:hypothetical protein